MVAAILGLVFLGVKDIRTHNSPSGAILHAGDLLKGQRTARLEHLLCAVAPIFRRHELLRNVKLLTSNALDAGVIKAELDVLNHRMTNRLDPASDAAYGIGSRVIGHVELNHKIHRAKDVASLGQNILQGAAELRRHRGIHITVLHLVVRRTGVADVSEVRTRVV